MTCQQWANLAKAVAVPAKAPAVVEEHIICGAPRGKGKNKGRGRGAKVEGAVAEEDWNDFSTDPFLDAEVERYLQSTLASWEQVPDEGHAARERADSPAAFFE